MTFVATSRGAEDRGGAAALAEAIEQTAEAIAWSDPTTGFSTSTAFRSTAWPGGPAGRYEELLADLQDEKIRTGLRGARVRGETWKDRLILKTPDGRQRDLEVKISAVRDARPDHQYAAIESDVIIRREICIRSCRLEAPGFWRAGSLMFQQHPRPHPAQHEMAQLEIFGQPVRRRLDTVIEATKLGQEQSANLLQPA
jgi:hypothetical protein